MPRVLAADLADHAGSTVKLAGWVHRRRELKSVTFVILRDRSGTAQVVLAGGDGAPGLREETVVEVVGRAVANPQAPGGVEVHDPVISTLSPVSEAPPVELFRPTMNAGLSTVLDHAAVTLRHPRSSATHRLAAAAMSGFRSTLDSLSFTEIQTPKIVASATESGANVFQIDYFGTRAYLAQSPQFYKQMMVGVYERVYEVGPVFRAEPHDTGRHLAEYVSLDAELGFVADHRDVMSVLRDVMVGMIASVESRGAGPFALLAVRLPVVPAEIPVIHFSTAQEMISDDTGEDLSCEFDLAPAHERWLGEWAAREHGSDFLFVEGYPMVKRPFYTYPERGRAAFSNSFDLLFRGQEIVTGGQRLHLYADYLAALAARGEEPEHYSGYLEAFRYGMPPHGGFAIGLGRFVARLVGAPNVREAVLFPRDLHRLSP
jgi:nondiscriminating aspartyl-tRNA synthetase